MKLRIQSNSIRLRLSGAEVDQFIETGSVTEAIPLGFDAVFTYALQRDENLPGIALSYQQNTLTVRVPTAITHAWTSTDQVGFDGKVGVAPDQELKILVEKDMECRHRPDKV